ncbi:transporter substrate-binding domain-containing protein [Pseudomonas aeruginosa]|uniref:transporter substrate-binding domain-containing protein n=1 Tax=Pseudomonas aeruginosa TaxID=287 RepID=UPI003D7D8C8F
MAIPYRKNNPKFGEALNAALEKIKADGRFAKLSEKWFGLDVSQPPKEPPLERAGRARETRPLCLSMER